MEELKKKMDQMILAENKKDVAELIARSEAKQDVELQQLADQAQDNSEAIKKLRNDVEEAMRRGGVSSAATSVASDAITSNPWDHCRNHAVKFGFVPEKSSSKTGVRGLTYRRRQPRMSRFQS